MTKVVIIENTYLCFIFVEYGTFQHSELSDFLEPNTKPHELVEKVITYEFLNTYIAAINAHKDEEFARLYPDGISKDEQCVRF